MSRKRQRRIKSDKCKVVAFLPKKVINTPINLRLDARMRDCMSVNINSLSDTDKLINRINFLEEFVTTSDDKATVNRAKKELKLLTKEYEQAC